jgi:hypothetical protein
MRRDLNTIAVIVDKNPGPVVATLAQYLKDCLLHLSDESTQETISREEAFSRDSELKASINETPVTTKAFCLGYSFTPHAFSQ